MPAGLYFIFRFLPLTEIHSDFFKCNINFRLFLILVFSILLMQAHNLKKANIFMGSCQFHFVINNWH